MNRKLLFYILILLLDFNKTSSQPLWESVEIIRGGRIDAIADCGNGVLLAGTRNPNPGLVFRSEDYGISWTRISTIERIEKPQGITCLACHEGRAYLLTENSDFFISENLGESWNHLGKLSKGKNTEGFALSYGIWITGKGTILVSDTHSEGGRVYRSTDYGTSFQIVPSFTDRALYRFEGYHEFVFVNGWGGTLYRSTDDGLTWEAWAKLDDSPLYATENTGDGHIIQGSESGKIFLVSASSKNEFTTIRAPGNASDDFVSSGNGRIFFSTYTEDRFVFKSEDFGHTWTKVGKINPDVPDDWLDHVIRIHENDKKIVVGGTNKGFIVRTIF